MIDTYGTSLNQVPAVVKKHRGSITGRVLNYGSGKWGGRVVSYLTKKSSAVVVCSYDKFGTDNLRRRPTGKFDSIIVANVLNVNENPEDTVRDLSEIAQRSVLPCKLFFSIYEGDKTGENRVTTVGYQRNERAITYIPLIEKYFKNVVRKGNIITCEGYYL